MPPYYLSVPVGSKTTEPAAADEGTAPASDRGSGSAGSLEALSEAIESGAGLPAVARAAAAALGASLALIDRSSAVLAVAASSGAEEEKLLAGAADVSTTELRVADVAVGELRYRRPGGADGAPAGLRMVTTLLGLEVERARSPEWASDEAAGDFLRSVLERRLADPEEIRSRANDLGSDLSGGAGVVIARAAPQATQTGDWRARVLTLTLRAVRSGSSGALAAMTNEERGEVAMLLPAADAGPIERAAKSIEDELRRSLSGFSLAIGFSRHAEDASQVYRAGKEALMAANVAESEDRSPLAFEETGSYRLLLPAMSEDPAELERFFDETVAPARRLRRPVRDRAGRDRRGLPRQRRQRHADRRDPLHPSPHRPLPPRARPRALRPRPELDRGPREARPRPQGDARPRHPGARRPGEGGPGEGREVGARQAGLIPLLRVRELGTLGSRLMARL